MKSWAELELFKLEETETSRSEHSENSDDPDELFSEGDEIDILPCENPIVNNWGVAVYGRQADPSGNPRSASTSINRIEFPDPNSTLNRSSSKVVALTSKMSLPWEEDSYSGYKLNCHKRKRKVLNMIELYDKDSVNSIQDKDIYQQKLNEIAVAALEASEYITDLIAQLEVNNEEGRIIELMAIKNGYVQAVKKNEKEVKAEIQVILDAAKLVPASSSLSLPDSIELVQTPEAKADKLSEDLIHKLTLRHKHIMEDAEDFTKAIMGVKVVATMTDSEIIYYMREIKTWDQKTKDLVTANRKFQEEAIGKEPLAELANVVDDKVHVIKVIKENKVAALTKEDDERGLSSLCENKNKSSVVFPDPFKGDFGENVFKFKEEIKAAIKDTQVKKADQVRTLLKYLKGDAKSRVGDHQPSLEAALEVLEGFYGNSNLIWLKYRQEFEQCFAGDVTKHWGELGSTKRVDAIAKMMEFIRQALQFAIEYPELKEDIISSHTVELLTKSMPVEYMEMVYLAVDSVSATHKEKIEKIQEILGKLKNCGILAVNQLVTKNTSSTPRTSRDRNQGTSSVRNPLGSCMSGGSLCSVDIKHDCNKSQKCQPSWGLLGCVELYKLNTVDERILYCKESNCCHVCGMAGVPGSGSDDQKCKRCDYKAPADRWHLKCTASWMNSASGRNQSCFYGAALCNRHQSQKNTHSKLLDWLKEKRVKHELFTLKSKHGQLTKSGSTSKKTTKESTPPDLPSDEKVMEMLREEMSKSDEEHGNIEDIPEGENMFMFFLLQGKPNTEPIQVFCDSGANFWFALESVTKKLICVRTHKGAMPISIGGGQTIFSTGEWAAALPMVNGGYQAVRGLTMKNVVGQMPRYDLTKALSDVQQQYPKNKKLQDLAIPSVLGGEVEMILGSKYLKIYPETIQVTPSGLTVSMFRLRSPNGMKTAVISGPVKFINTIFQSQLAGDAIKSMKAMLLHARDYRPTLEFFPKSNNINMLVDEDIPGISELTIEDNLKKTSATRGSQASEMTCTSCGSLGVTVQGELRRFMELQEAGLKTEFRCRQCRQCDDCRKGAGSEKVSLQQEAEQELIKESIDVKPEGFAVGKLPFILPPEKNLKSNRNIALKRLDSVLKKYCKDENMREGVIKAWDKMISKQHLVFIKDLSMEHQKMLAAAVVSYWIPWNINFKDSISTPIRTTFDASSTTHTGLSLNDCLAKGTPDLVELLALILEWMMGPSAFCGDISQFYPSILLDPQHWQYQRILLRKNLDPEGELLEAVLVKLAFGVQSVSAQSEEAVKRVAKELWETFPQVAFLLIKRRYVDDLGKSTNSKDESMELIKKTSEVLMTKLGMKVKGWSMSGEKPPPEVSKDGISVDFGGMVWYTEPDIYTLNTPALCLDKKQRGRLPEGSFGFDVKSMSMEEYVPMNLTRRQITRALAKVWDLLGKLTPVTLRMKHDLRKLISETPEWDVAVSQLARSLWIQNFTMLEEVRGLMYMRCTRPDDAIRKTCRLWVMVDAAEWRMIVTIYAGWERKCGKYSCSHLFGKGLLGPESSTLPQKELHILSVGADIAQLLSNILEEWVEEVLVASDSEIALCWSSYETVKLNQYNRVRVINIVSKISLQNLYHIKGTQNPADIGTRMKFVSSEDVFPGSEYLTGKQWMQLSKEAAIKEGVIKPIEQIKLGHEAKKIAKKGIVYDSFEKGDADIFAVLVVARVDVAKVAEREVEAKYPFSPLIRNFLTFVNITAILLKWRKKTPRKKLKLTNQQQENKPTRFSIASYYSPTMVRPLPDEVVNEVDRNEALTYIFKIETKLVKKFNSKKKLEKISIEEGDILFCKSRVLEGERVKVVGGLKIDTSLAGLFDLNFKVPLIDEHSPLAYPLALHLHDPFNHKGYESCYRLSMNFVRILGGLKIFKNINSNCVTCMKERKRYMKMVMGSLTESQLTISPVFYFTQVDMWGPLRCYCPGYERLTRRDKSYEIHLLVFSCVATGAVNVQVLEGKSTEFVLEGCSRFFNETSVPKIMYPDEDSALVAAFKNGEINIEDLSGSLYRTKNILFETCAPQAHYSHGRVERVVRSLQQSLSRSGASSCRLTATGWMTIAKAMEREVNNVPIGFLYDKTTVDGNPILRILRPSTLKGMNASDRAPSGLYTIPDLPEEHFNKVQEAYNMWAKCWATSYLPLILERQKWHGEDPNLAMNDVVFFKLVDSVLKADWRLGKVDTVKIGRDVRVREANIAYKIMKKDGWTHNVVTRPIREIIKLFEIGDTTFAEEMKAVHKAARDIIVKRGAIEVDDDVSKEVSEERDDVHNENDGTQVEEDLNDDEAAQ